MKRRLLICIDWFDPAYKAGGPIRSVLNMIKYVLADFDVFVLTSNRDLDEVLPLKNIMADDWVDHHSGAKICYLSKGNMNFKNILSRIKEVGPTVLYLNSQFSKSFTIYPLIVNRFFQQIDKVVLAPRGMLKDMAMSQKGLKKSIFNSLMRRTLLAPNIVFQSTDDHEHIEIIHKMKIPSQRVVQAGNIPVSLTNPKRERTSGSISKFILVSRLAPHKNIDLLLTSLKSIETPLILTLVGAFSSEKYKGRCQEIISTLPEHIKVVQMGARSPIEIPDLLASHDIFVLPTKGENFGHSIFEAFAQGLPVIIGRNVPWIDIEEKKVGWLIDESKSSHLTQAIEACLELSETEYLEMSNNALNYARSYFEQADFEKQYDALFN